MLLIIKPFLSIFSKLISPLFGQYNSQYSDSLHEFKQRLSRQKKHMHGIEAPSWLSSIFGGDDSMMTQEMGEMLSMKSDFIDMDNAAMPDLTFLPSKAPLFWTFQITSRNKP